MRRADHPLAIGGELLAVGKAIHRHRRMENHLDPPLSRRRQHLQLSQRHQVGHRMPRQARQPKPGHRALFDRLGTTELEHFGKTMQVRQQRLFEPGLDVQPPEQALAHAGLLPVRARPNVVANFGHVDEPTTVYACEDLRVAGIGEGRGSVLPLTNGLWFWSVLIALVAWTLVQRHGEVPTPAARMTAESTP